MGQRRFFSLVRLRQAKISLPGSILSKMLGGLETQASVGACDYGSISRKVCSYESYDGWNWSPLIDKSRKVQRTMADISTWVSYAAIARTCLRTMCHQR